MNDAKEYLDNAQRGAAELADRYVTLWNEPDPARRRELISGLWTENGTQILQAPEEARKIAASPGIGMNAVLEAHGHAELEQRATSAYEHWGASEGASFRRRDDADRVHDIVKFHWEAVDKDGEVFAVGLNVFVLAEDGRIRRDYSFVVG